MSRIDRLERAFSPEIAAEKEQERKGDGVDYLDPEVQHRVLNPKRLGPYVLAFDDGRPDKTIFVRTAFTPDLVNRRRILDEIDSMQKFTLSLLSRHTPDGRPPTAQWCNDNTFLIGWAYSQPDVLEMGRSIIAKLSEVTTPDGEPIVPAAGVTIAEISDGLTSDEVSSIIVAFVFIMADFRKNLDRAKTARESAPERSMPA